MSHKIDNAQQDNVMSNLRQHKAWRTLLLAGTATLALSGCPGDGDDGEDGEQGPPGEVNVNIADATSLQAEFTGAEVTDGTASVTFLLTTANGIAVAGLESYAELDRLGMGIAKLAPLQKRSRPLPGTTVPENDPTQFKGTKSDQWTSYINNLVEPGEVNVGDDFPENWDQFKGTQIQAGIETGCGMDENGDGQPAIACLEAIGNGEYRYTFPMALADYPVVEGIDTTYDENLTHRITMELRRFRGDSALVNAFYDFIPATGEMASADQTREMVVLEEACLRCHSNDYTNDAAHPLILHGGARFALENCTVCHTTYSGDPETGATVDFGSMLHQIHKAEYFMIGFGGNGQDYREVTFPANGNDCSVCHLEGEDAPAQATNWYFHRQEACLSCHEKFAPADWDGTARGLFHADSFTPWVEGNCAGCHADDTNLMASAIYHSAKDMATENARTSYSYELGNGTYDPALGTLTFTLTWAGEMAPEMDPNVKSFWVNAAAFDGTEYDMGGVRADDLGSPFGRHKSRISFDLKTANMADSVVTSVAGEGGITYTVSGIDPLVHDLFNTTGQGFLDGKLFVCASASVVNMDTSTLVPVACDNAETRVIEAVVAGNKASFSVDGSDVTMRQLVALEMGCVNCHAEQADFSSSHVGTRGDETYPPNSACGSCHAGTPNTAVFLTDGSCVSCHNPHGSAHSNKPFERGFDFKVMIHEIHAGTRSERRTTDLEITYPDTPANCYACHEVGQLDLGSTAAKPPTLIGEVEYSPTVAACAACHATTEAANPSAVSHFRANGGVYEGTMGEYAAGGNAETCATCHSAGRSSGYDAAHGLME
ncbi:OmcA/MtrC family decaheme c-type cytochrome [Ferrimonas marina]|uniref:Decaheme c-type cytochrome, OmcA/MtrC family n=1 Tax=Ferrimonas marina TaxID=299255 RepID=A0A1M5YU21_9GAMM|nr:OmcA/MtrC family decaheme c-type cytochrome [Ferrimonas marina]SHI15536.1 decaheme c-type cytochrome, OmcA/MtrC family [Ferrimonas marina]